MSISKSKIMDDVLVADASLPQITIDTKFNQGYTVASPVNGGGEAVAVCNRRGMVELFTQGTDGTIWNFYPDSTSDTGYSGVSTNLKGTTFNAGADSSGNIVVLAAIGTQLSYIVENTGGSNRWSNPAVLSLPRTPAAAIAVSAIFVQDIANQLYVGVLMHYNSMPGPSYALSYSVWNSSAPSFQAANVNYNTLNCVWVGNTPQTASVACVQTTVSTYNVYNRTIGQYSMSSTFTSLSVCSALDNNNQSQIFAVLADGNVNQLVTKNNGTSYYWVPLSQGMIFRQVGTALDGSTGLVVFGVSGDNQLYNWTPSSQSQSGFSNPASIATGVSLMGLAINDGGAVDLFTIGTSANNLNHIYLEEVSMNWSNQILEVPNNGVLQQYISYSTDISATDATGVPLVNAPVTIYTTEECHLSINGAVYFVNANEPAYLSTNASGIISISQQTGTLAIPPLEINYTGQMAPTQRITIDPSANVQDKLAVVTGTELMDARDQDGSYMIGDQYRTVENTDSMSKAFNDTMNAVGVSSASVRTYPNMKHGDKRGVWLRDKGTLQDARRLNGERVRYQLSFDGNRVIYESLTEDRVKEILATKQSLPTVEGFFDWIGDIGDFLGGVIDGVIDVVNVVVDAIGSAINAAITFIVDGVTYLYNTVITIVEQALDLIETIFAQVLVFLEKVWEWIGFLFSWNDILRTHEAISYSINQFLGFLGGSLTGMQKIVDTNFAAFQGQVANIFQQAITQIAGNYTLGGYNQSNEQQSPQFESATSNNIVYNSVVNNPGSISSTSNLMIIAADDPMMVVLNQLLQMGISAEATTAFSNALAYFGNLGGSPDQIFSCLMAGLLSVAEGIVLTILSTVQAVVDALFQLGVALINTLQNTLNEEWDIPIISQLYSWLTGGSSLTTLDLLSLLIAIPVTFTYKIVYNKSPFPDGASVTAFKNSFTSQSMLNASGLGGAQAQAKAALEAPSGLAPQYNTLFATMGAVSTCIGGWITAVNDAFPKDAPSFLSKITWTLSCCSQVASFPWWTSAAAPSCDYNNQEGAENMLWIFCNVGICMDAVFIGIEKRVPESTGDAGLTVQMLYAALGHTTFAILASIKADGMEIACNILPVVPEICKLLKYTTIVTASEGISLAVLAAVDALFYTTTGILDFINATSSSDEVLIVKVAPAMAI